MRFLRVRLTGYIGIYNGLGLPVIDIDFTNARNKICIISGPNGVGKSTLNKAMNILPDSTDNFVPSMGAEKYLQLTDGINVYDITFSHPLDKNNKRVVTKASICKNGLELNPNGNVSSYKEIIFNEFDMDGNYATLSKISGDNRGLADKTPSERKKFMSSIISSLEVYNSIYKNLNKKANVFKSYINNLSSKIQNIGDESYLRSTLEGLEKREISIKETIDVTQQSITQFKTIIAMTDPDGKMQEEYNNSIGKISDLENTVSDLYKKISREDSISIEKIDKEIESTSKVIESNQNEVTELSIKRGSILSSITSISENITRDNINISKLSTDIDPSLIISIEKYKEILKGIMIDLSSYSVTSYDDISKDEISYIITLSTNIIQNIDILYSEMNDSDFAEINNIMCTDIKKEYEDQKETLELLRKNKEENDKELVVVQTDEKFVDNLHKRPKTCKDDSCFYVTKQLQILSKYGTVIDLLGKRVDLGKKSSYYEDLIKETEQKIKDLERQINIRTKLDTITDTISTNYAIISKFPMISQKLDKNALYFNISHQDRFNVLRDMNSYNLLSNLIIEYKENKQVLDKLSSEYNVQVNTEKFLKEYQSDLEKNQKELESMNEDLSKLNGSITFAQNVVQSSTDKVNRLYNLKDTIASYNASVDELNALKSKSTEISNKFNESLGILDKIQKQEALKESTMQELKPLQDKKKVIESQLTMLDSFKSEYDMYKEKFMYLDKLRMYSSPTNDSIQALFMGIYMDKTLSIVNQLLGMIFNGQYKILQYVINEDEFRIPFLGNGLPVDDISSGSTSQVCIMGTIINLVLMNVGSSKFGIASLDEVDGGLDQYNRYMFVDVIQKICDILHIDQLFTISHSIESALNNVDVILLSDSQEYKDLFSNTNIIYQYSREG